MRHVILLDNKITDEEYQSWVAEDELFWQTHIGMTPQYWVIRQDFSDYPTYIDEDGDIRPTQEYLQSLSDLVQSKYEDYGTDFVILAIHEDNWKSDPDGPGGIWGTAYAYVFNYYLFTYCRWDKDNPANVFGTMYHERFHCFDALIKVETGINIDTILGTLNFDREVVHGQHKDYEYIRYKENTDVLAIIAPYLRNAFSLRSRRHEGTLQRYKNIIGLLNKALYLLRVLVNKKNGVSRW